MSFNQQSIITKGEGQFASDQHRASLAAAEQQIERACLGDQTEHVELAVELAEAHINLGKLQNELSEKVRTVATYEAEILQHVQ